MVTLRAGSVDAAACGSNTTGVQVRHEGNPVCPGFAEYEPIPSGPFNSKLAARFDRSCVQ